MLRFAADGKPVQFVSSDVVDGECLRLNVTYNPSVVHGITSITFLAVPLQEISNLTTPSTTSTP